MNREDSIARFISDELLRGRMTIGHDDDLLATGMIDSLGMVRLVGFIEKSFGYRVPPKDFTIENFETVAVIGAYLERSLDGSG